MLTSVIIFQIAITGFDFEGGIWVLFAPIPCHCIFVNFSDREMRVQTILLVVVSSIGAADKVGDTGRFHHAAEDTSIFRKNISPRDNIGVLQANSLRQKRGTSSILRAWTRLLRTTFGFEWVKVRGADKVKTYVKVGTLDDAVTDFKSLGPTEYRQLGNTLFGQAGNKFVMLDVPSDAGQPKLYFETNNYFSRLIYYVESPKAAHWLLQELKKLSDLQGNHPTIH